MSAYQSIVQLLTSIAVIILAIMVVIGVISKITKVIKGSIADQKEQISEETTNIKGYIWECLLNLVVESEQLYGPGTGLIKKSKVYKDLIDLFPSLEDYITDGDIFVGEIGDLIDDAVNVVNAKSKTKEEISDIFKKM